MKRRVNIVISNKKSIRLILLFWIFCVLFFFFTYVVNVISFSFDLVFSEVRSYFITFLLFFFIYIIRLPRFYLIFDKYSIYISSNLLFSYKKNYVDISHSMFSDYSFLRKGKSNRILVVKFYNEASQKILVRRFFITLLKKSEIKLLEKTLESIKKKTINE